MDLQTLHGVVVRGYRVASGTGTDSPYPAGSIEMQTPHFLERGLDLRGYYPGTLNVSIHPATFDMKSPAHTFRDVAWSPAHPAEDFSFASCCVAFLGNTATGLVYYPHPETKPGHFQATSTLELLLPYLDGIGYGSAVTLYLDPAEIEVHQP